MLTYHEDLWGSGGTAPCILNLSARWRQLVSFTPWLLYHWGERPWYSLNRKLSGPQSWSGCGGKEKKFLSLA